MMLTSTQIGELAAQFFIAGAGTLCFAILFACPRKSLFFCGLVGAVGWFVYELAVMLGADSAAASPAGGDPPHPAHPGVRHHPQNAGDGVPAVRHLPAGARCGHLLHRLLFYTGQQCAGPFQRHQHL